MSLVSASVLLLVLCVHSSDAHGRLIQPTSRGSLWRFGYENPPNYEDNQLFCGGKQNQWNIWDGKCGLCGDPYQGPREHEAGGIYANNIIAGYYKTSGQISVTVEITANHLGYSEFRLCENNDFSKNFTQKCIDENLLKEVRTTETRLSVGNRIGNITWNLQLPEGLTCTQCVLQWKYRTANTWGCDEVGKCCTGCGMAQEEFYGCSDIAIADE